LSDHVLDELGYYLPAGAGGDGPATVMDEARRGEELGDQMEDWVQVMRRLWRGEVIFNHDGPIGKYPVLVRGGFKL
jgi:alkanesulfonate monooxygenase SsuD/methylene tetrahydromethanopterin reductase-like flavin-dependent oxidoreductase (luciferase family)